jgi:hypothetical protein
VRAAGVLDDAYNQHAGEALADTMMAAQGLAGAMGDMPIYVLSVQASHSGAFNDEILRYIAETGGGELFTVGDTDTLRDAMHLVYAEQACDEASEPPAPVVIEAPEVNPSTCADLTLTVQEQEARRRVRLVFANGSDVAMTTQQLAAIRWPAPWGAITSIKALDGRWTDVAPGAPAQMAIEGYTLGAGKTGEVLLQFESQITGDAKALMGYLEMASGCRASFGGGLREAQLDTPGFGGPAPGD